MSISLSISSAERVETELLDDDCNPMPPPEPSEFNSIHLEGEIKPEEVWAVYDEKDGMPRRYAYITEVSRCPFKARFWWLVPHLSTGSDFDASCGEFEDGDYASSNCVNIFSHRMTPVQQPSLDFEANVGWGSESLWKIYPQIGEVWAMHIDSVQAGKTAGKRTLSEISPAFDIVEIIDRVDNRVETVSLIRESRKGTVFCRQQDTQVIQCWFLVDLVKFSHKIMAVKLNLSISDGALEEAWDLDPAAIPWEDSEEVLESTEKVTSQFVNESMEPVSKHTWSGKKSEAPSPQKARRMEADANGLGGPADCDGYLGLDNNDTGEVDQMSPVKGASSSTLAAAATIASNSDSQGTSVGPPNGGKFVATPELHSTSFYNFNQLRTRDGMEAGQVWAIYDPVDRMPRLYARIIRVLDNVSPLKLEVWRLKPYSSSIPMKSWMDRTGLTVSWGQFANDRRELLGLNEFSHMIVASSKPVVHIYPQREEVWAKYRKPDWEVQDTRSEIENQSYVHPFDLVAVLSNFNKNTGPEMVKLTKVEGFETVFKRCTKRAGVSDAVYPESLFEFSHRIPAQKLFSDPFVGIPVGAYELDPAGLLGG